MTSLQLSMTYNIGSLLLGTGAWILAGLAIAARDAGASRRNSMLSFGLCTAALVLRLFEIGNRAAVGDFAAIADTIRAVLIASVTLVAVTVILNLLAYFRAKKR